MNTDLAAKYRRIQQQLFTGIAALGVVITGGTLWYWLVEQWRLIDALYMTVITLSTVGFLEVHPLGDRGHLFTVLLIFSGVAWLGYVVNRFTEAIVQGYFQGGIQLLQQQRLMDTLDNHYIVCGFGRTGQQIAAELRAERLTLVVIDADPEVLVQARAQGYATIQGRATLDLTLQQAGIAKARGLISALPSDADNLYTLVSAKTLNPDIRVVVRATTEEATQKFNHVGADAVVSPYQTIGKRMAQAALRPQVVNFVDVALTGDDPDVFIEEVVLTAERCPYVGQTLGQAAVRSQTGASVLALRRTDGTLISGPTGKTDLQAGDLLICMGTSSQLTHLNQYLSSPNQAAA